MDATHTDISDSPPGTGTPPAAGSEPARCDECGAAVEREQRYCVNCGAHRRTANDPAARYFGQASARNRAAAGTRVGRVRDSQRANGLVLALALAVIPVSVGIGVVVGRSSNNDDGKIVQALDHRNAAATADAPAATGSSSATQTSTAPATSTTTGKHKSTSSKHHKSASKSRTHKHSASTPSKGPSAAQKAGYGSSSSAKTKVGGGSSAAAAKQGAKIVQKEKNAKGTSYLNQLPQQVVVP
jgi:hypothetical protein